MFYIILPVLALFSYVFTAVQKPEGSFGDAPDVVTQVCYIVILFTERYRHLKKKYRHLKLQNKFLAK